MFTVLNQQTKLTGNQKRIVVAAIIGDMLDFFDFFVMRFAAFWLLLPVETGCQRLARFLQPASVNQPARRFRYPRSDRCGSR